jgi:hypothetical protein
VQGNLIYTATTNSSGWYGLEAPLGYEYYTIVEVNPEGYDSVDATTVDGIVLDADHIRYAHPLAGQSLTGNKFWDSPIGGALPDLIITEVWGEGGTICYQVMNIGTSAAPSGHETRLEIDGGWVETKQVPIDLAPDQQFVDCFAAVWSCSAPEDSVEVTADAGAAVEESSEDNNTRMEILPCDTIPPEIIEGPHAIDITPVSALIYWVTTEPTSSDVFFGTFAQSLTGEKHDGTPVFTHEVLLEDLLPYTTYRYRVHSADGSGNAAESGVHTFRTHAEPDGIVPSVELPDPGEITGTVAITATASDNAGVDRVQFFIDGALVFTDYSTPYVLVMDSQAFDNGPHMLDARVFDKAGNAFDSDRQIDIGNVDDKTAPTVNITNPANGAILAGPVNVTAALNDDIGLAQVFFKVVQGTNVWTWGFEGLPANPTSYNASFEWDTKQVANGSYRVAIETYDTEGKYGYDVHDVTVNQSVAVQPAKLKVVGHTATRYGNGFLVALTVKNVGGETASNVTIEDTLQAFQPISRTSTSAPAAIYHVAYDPYIQQAEAQITALGNIASGQTVTFTYGAAPVLFYPTSPTPTIGQNIYLHWNRPGGTRLHDIVAVPIPAVGSDTLAAAHAKAVKTADYIVMTNPSRLFGFGYPDIDAVYGVLSEMAQLAIYQQGVLGYLNTTDRGKIDALLEPTGTWAKKLSSKFSTALGGYVLIVGEREIVPTSFWGNFNLTWSNSTCTTTQVQDSDLSYANTSGDNAPELIVGRAIGNDPQDLYNVLHTSNAVYEGQTGYGFDRSHALLVSGTDGSSSIQDKFTGFINDAAKIINSDYAVTKIHWSNYATNMAGLAAFTGATSGKDLIVYQGHGSPDGWGPFTTNTFNGFTGTTPPIPAVDFGSANPLVMGLACLTGAYEDHTANTCSYDGGDDNIAEAFLDAGAGVYIGSTEVSSINKNVQAGKEFFQTQWASHSTTIGEAFTALKRTHATSSDSFWRFWVVEYNLYGDPKYGVLPSPSTATVSPPKPAAAPAPALAITVPDYTVTTRDGIDYVEIPGGSLLMEEGMPQVPTYITLVDYPAGYRIQNVFLTARSGLTTAFGLNLPVHENLFATDEALPAVTAFHSTENAWYPERDYDWTILDNPDGSTTLVLTIYPFAYNGTTTESRFHADYSFVVEFAETNLRITELSVDQNEYNYGEMLNATLAISSTGESGDIAVGCVIKHAGTGDVVVELMMETLTALEGKASFTTSWPADNVPQDNYFIECSLSNPGGLLFDRQMEMFYLGTTRGEVIDFRVSPATFTPGTVVTASLTFHNSGTVNLNGTLVVDVRDSAGTLVDTLSQIFTDLAPAHSTSYDAEWHTPLNSTGTYHLTGYALYNSSVSEPERLTATAWSRVMLPVVLRK